ncbi:NepR family anti-sigma factor [uncultured Sphingomonas sp.]|uniref:NepR family anti-sigma factor n=1 Tax=uncultured Sphingomonas sp. TaxID=158754 RepID=UPI002625819C|nr:NepR family anti-sigma factor [uncultured Sphingomonas sp.]
MGRPPPPGMPMGDVLHSNNEKRGSSSRPPSRRKQRSDVEAANGSVGRALRSVYQKTVEEDVPAEMLDLLGKLG